MPVIAQGSRIVFMGSPDFAVPSLRALVSAGHDVGLVVTQPDRPAGRGGHATPPPVKVAALELGLPVLQPDSLKDAVIQAAIAAAGPEVIAVAAYGKILPRAVLAIPARGCVNVHASLLPRWRGASPIAAAILAGDQETGVTIMEMAPKMDAGAVISQARTPISPAETTGSLERGLAAQGAELLVQALPRWLDGSLRAVPQDEALATYCWTLSKADGHLSGEMDVFAAERAVRAYNPWPGAYVLYGESRLAIWAARAVADEGSQTAGAMSIVEQRPAVAFDGGWLVLDEVQKPGGRRITGEQFLNGERGSLLERAGLRE